MQKLQHFLTPVETCGYLPDQVWRHEYEIYASLFSEDYADQMLEGWRRFGRAVFRPRCPTCTACQSLRVEVAAFTPNRSQRRNRKTNEEEIRLRIGRPAVSEERLQLYDRYHNHQHATKGWPLNEPKDAGSYAAAFVDNPFRTEEWTYWLADRLVGVGYVDRLSVGLSAIYFYHEPELQDRGLGTWNVLALIAEARQRNQQHVYLGYYVAGCRSLEYKARFRPNEVLGPDGQWRRYRT
ncbi:MAG TPA: arginyltransferase [Gemmatales bacterium]|nr:arginyltransferase [Gemmatales bacterium]HMP58094.1 arginyltransferase [Gemmatales bacterium]